MFVCWTWGMSEGRSRRISMVEGCAGCKWRCACVLRAVEDVPNNLDLCSGCNFAEIHGCRRTERGITPGRLRQVKSRL